MAKFSGFCMSALLIVICLWINVCRYPNAFDACANVGAGASRLRAVSQSSAHLEARSSSGGAANVSRGDFNASDASIDSEPDDDSTNAVDDPQAGASDRDASNVDAPSSPNESKSNAAPAAPQKKSAPASDAPEPIVAESSLDESFDRLFDADFEDASASKLRDLKPLAKGLGPVAKGLGGDATVANSARANFESASARRGVSSELAPEPSRGVPARLEAETSAKLSANSDSKAKSNGPSKPQGGKYVSIPSIETDALAPTAFEADCRVVGATRAENVFFDVDD